MNDSDPQPQAMQSPKNQIPQSHNEVHDSNQHPPSNPPEVSTLDSTGSAHGGPEHLSASDRQNAMRHIKSLETHNAKLYEDNCQLVNAVNMLNDRLAFIGASQNTQVLYLAEMQEKLRASETNRGLLNRKYQELLLGISANSAHHHLATELQGIRNAYATLDHAHRVLGEKYARLKATLDPRQQSFTASAPHVAHGPHTLAPNGVLLHPDQHRINSLTPPSGISPTSISNPIVQYQNHHQRRSSEGVIGQQPGPPFRHGLGQITTAWLAPLPTPPPSAPVNGTQISPGFPIHPPMSAGPHPLARRDHPAHMQRAHGSRTMSGPPILSHHPVSVKVPKVAVSVEQRRSAIDLSNDEPAATKPIKPLKPSSPQSLKRPNSDLQVSGSPEGGNKRPRIEEEAQIKVEKPTTPAAEPDSAKASSPSAGTEDQKDGKPATPSSGNDVRSYEDCVNLIFEKDADVENGVFCGLCLDRYEAKMIPEPPDVLVQPDFDLLVRHCMTMHPAVWDDLRHRKS